MNQLQSRWMLRRLPPPGSKFPAFARRAADLAGLPQDLDWELAIRFVGDAAMIRANRELVGHEGTTDVITFSYFDDPESLFPGDVALELIVNPDAAVREGARRAGGYSRELALYVVHGMLHAAGEDDLDDEPRKHMRLRESEVLAALEKEFDFAKIFPQKK